MFFGTDGIRGEYGKAVTTDIAFALGNALTQIKQSPSVVIGHDTRCSADALTLAVATGIVKGGGNVTSVGCIPTAGISYLTESEKFDFGLMLTASHNPPNHNGIKIFDKSGRKISGDEEEFLEEFFKNDHLSDFCGHFKEDFRLQKKYAEHLKNSIDTPLDGMTIFLDASNGSASRIAPEVFKSLGANVHKIACGGNGEKINVNCGCLHIDNLIKHMQKSRADIGFAFDGDADRVIAVGSKGDVFDGDKLLYILAKDMKEHGLLYANSVVGTSHTNSGIMVGLNRNKINLIRTDIGDKYVIEAMEKMNLTLGGEQSGHIIIRTHASTGDGILTALKVCEIMKKSGKSLEKLFDAQLIFQCNINLVVKDKIKVLNNEDLKNLSTKIINEIAPAGRLLIRASGTEDLIRVMVEHPSPQKAKAYAAQIENLIAKI